MRAWALALAALPLATVAIADGTAPSPPVPTLAIPAGWTSQPTLVDAARRAASAAAGARAVTVAAWGQPLLGCFATAVVVDLAAGERGPRVMAELQRALGGDVTVESGATASALAARVQRPGWNGALRGQVGGRPARATVVACFYNDRAPARCSAACDSLVSSLPPVENP